MSGGVDIAAMEGVGQDVGLAAETGREGVGDAAPILKHGGETGMAAGKDGMARRGSDKRLAGDLAVWVFILSELLAFAVFFAAYAFTRARHVEMFNTYQQTLDRNLGALNTVLLITGSWFVVRAVQAAHGDRVAALRRNLLLGFVCGGGFLAVKMVEYAEKFAAGISLSTNTFYMFYISLTFFHFMHVILGMVILAILWVQAGKGVYGSHDAHGLESGAAYWHMVDLLWIILFPLVYVMR